MSISRPAVSRHLRLLKDAGMVAERAQGTRRIYCLQERGIEAVREYLDRIWGEAATRFQLLAENTEAGPAGARTPEDAGFMTAPLRMSLDVECSAEHAFTVWTSGIATWWPTDHTVTGRDGVTVVMQSGLAGGSTSARPTGRA